MSGEEWTTPVTNRGTTAIPTTWINTSAEGNISVNGRGGGRDAITTAVSASELTLPNEYDDVFHVSGSVTIDFIDTTNRQAINKIWLIFTDAGCGIRQGASSPSDPKFKPIYYNGTGALSGVSLPQRSLIPFIYTGVYWSTLYYV